MAPRTFIFIILTARLACLLQPTISFTYNAISAQVKLGTRTQINGFPDTKFLHVPRSVIIYYLDARSAQEVTKAGKTLTDCVRKETWERPADEVAKEFARDEEENTKYREAYREWKRNQERKDGDKTMREPQKPNRTVDPKITGTKKLMMINLSDRDESGLKVQVIELTLEQLVLAVYYAPAFDVLSFNTEPNGEIKLAIGSSWTILKDSAASEFRMGFDNRPAVISGKTGEAVPATDWVSPGYLSHFLFSSSASDDEQTVYTTYVAQMTAFFVQYERSKILRLRGGITKKRIGLQIEFFPSMFQAVLDLPRPDKIGALRVRLQNTNEPLQTVWEGDLSQPSLEFDFDRDIPSKYQNAFTGVSSPQYFLRVADNALQLEGTLKIGTKVDRFAMKAMDGEKDVRLSLYLARGNLTPDKETVMLPKTNNKPFKFFWVLPPSNLAYHVQFDRKVLLDLSFMKKQHFGEMMRATPLFNGGVLSLSPLGTRPSSALDFAWATNFQNVDVSMARHSGQTVTTADDNLHFFYPRADGFLVSVTSDRATLFAFTKANNEYKDDLTIPINGFFPGKNLQLSLVLFDVDNGMQRFEFSAFPVLGRELFFAKMGTSMQEQLSKIKVEVCEATSSSLVLCVFNLRSSFELDVYPNKGKAVYWRDYEPTHIEGLRSGVKATPVFMVEEQCFLPKATRFTAFSFSGFEKWFVEAHHNQHRDPGRAVVHCPSSDSTCFVFFPSNFDAKPTSGRLKDFKIGQDGVKCSMGVESMVDIYMDPNVLNFLFKNQPETKVSFQFVTPFEWSNKLTFLGWGQSLVKLSCRDEKDGRCGYSWVTYNQEKVPYAPSLLLARDHPLNMPLLLYKTHAPALNLEPRHSAGQITLTVSLKAFEISTSDVSMGYAEFVRVKVYQKSQTVSRATLSLFLLGLAPVTVPLTLRRPENFLQLLNNPSLTDFSATIPGNVDPFFVFTLFNHITTGRYSIYCVEDDKGVMQLIVYRSSDLGVYELIDGLVRGQLDNFQDFLDPKKRRADKQTIFQFDFAAQKSEDEGFTFKKTRMFTRFRTAFAGVEVMVCGAGFERLARPDSITLISSFRANADAGRVAGLIVPADQFEGASDGDDRLRI